MAVISEKFDVPDDMMEKIFSGELRRIGGVLRYAEGPKKGEIVKLLDPIGDNDAESKSEVSNAQQSANEQIIGFCVGAIVVGVGAGVSYLIWRVKKTKEIRAFENALNKYIDALKNGIPSVLLINELSNSIQKLKNRKDYEKCCVSLSAGDLVALVDMVFEYTQKMAVDNSVDISSVTQIPTNDFMNRLEQSLEAQKSIIQLVA